MSTNLEVFDFETKVVNGVHVPIIIAWTDGQTINSKYLIYNNKNNLDWLLEAGDYRSQVSYIEQLNVYGDMALKIILKNFKSNAIYYAHNLIFDFSLIFSALRRANIEFKWVFINYKLFEVRILLKNKTIVFKCSYKLFPFSLKNLNPHFTNRVKLDFPYELLTNWGGERLINLKIQDSWVSLKARDALDLHVKNDCLLLKEAINYFFDSILKLAELKKTKININGVLSIGGLALNWLGAISKHKINLNLKSNIINQVKQAYRGGRCEIFGNPVFGEKVLHFDFKNMYLSCMGGEFPIDELKFIENPIHIDAPGFYHIEIEYYGNLPILPIKKNKLIFPQGKLKGLFWYEEIKLAIENTTISKLQINYAFLTHSTAPLLSEFVESLNALMRINGHNKIAKGLANALYGRLGMTESLNITRITKHECGEKLEYAQHLLENVILTKKKPKSNVIIAAIITSRARIKLYEGFLKVIGAGGRLLYTDTDSIIAAFPKDLPIENEQLGDVCFDSKIKSTKISDCVFALPKTYALKYSDSFIIRAKGINCNEVSFESFKNRFYGGGSLSLYKQSLKKTNGFEYHYYNESIKVDLQNYDKRIFIKNKTQTEPLTFDMSKGA